MKVSFYAVLILHPLRLFWTRFAKPFCCLLFFEKTFTLFQQIFKQRGWANQNVYLMTFSQSHLLQALRTIPKDKVLKLTLSQSLFHFHSSPSIIFFLLGYLRLPLCYMNKEEWGENEVDKWWSMRDVSISVRTMDVKKYFLSFPFTLAHSISLIIGIIIVFSNID